MKSRWKITMNFRGFSGKEEERGKRTNQKESKRISCVRRFGRAVFLSQRGERGALHAEGQEKIDWKKRSQHTLQQEGGVGSKRWLCCFASLGMGCSLSYPKPGTPFGQILCFLWCTDASCLGECCALRTWVF